MNSRRTLCFRRLGRRMLFWEDFLVKRKLPRSIFTKRGPGILSRAKEAFCALNPEEKSIAIERGWVPARWLR